MDILDSSITIEGETASRVALTGPAAELLLRLWDRHGPLMFHQSGGCCDGSSPMCFPAGEFITGDSDVLLGRFDLAGGAGADAGAGPKPLEFWMSKEQFNYWSHTHLTVDVVKGRGSGFSVEAPEGVRFLIRSRLVDGFHPA
jgi:hypothetical protein